MMVFLDDAKLCIRCGVLGAFTTRCTLCEGTELVSIRAEAPPRRPEMYGQGGLVFRITRAESASTVYTIAGPTPTLIDAGPSPEGLWTCELLQGSEVLFQIVTYGTSLLSVHYRVTERIDRGKTVVYHHWAIFQALHQEGRLILEAWPADDTNGGGTTRGA